MANVLCFGQGQHDQFRGGSEKVRHKVHFDNLTPLYPDERLKLEVEDRLEGFVISYHRYCGADRKGQRALICCAASYRQNRPVAEYRQSRNCQSSECYLIVLLIDERPEEVTDMQRSVKGEVVSSTFDEPAVRHVQVAEMVIEKAKRLVEHGRDVVILLDSITRLGRAYNTVVPSSGKVYDRRRRRECASAPEEVFRCGPQH